ncbi:esterase E4-like [Cloeon dipterum]|uniref:esterase E4-like n=1 Tax=Cloeon dipterum TaxID=197152 RepID=UPI0032200C50
MQSLANSGTDTMCTGFYLASLFALLGLSELACGSAIQVEVEQGVLQGAVQTSHSGKPFLAFHAIPYAAPPIGPLRFKDPSETKRWEGVRDATKKGPVCIQRDVLFSHSDEIFGQEDCLYLDVYTPNVLRKGENITGSLPVLVYFHGGGWLCGSAGTYGPDYLMDQDIVLVTPNYRLGVFGFLSTEDKTCPGNFGMKDQVAALKWVQTNIGAFGGDAGMVTISGESAGGASVHYHMISPLSQGLFTRAISMSGTVFAPWAFAPNPVSNARKYAMANGCTFDNSEELVDCLMKKEAYDLIDTQDVLYEWVIDPILPFRPCQEPQHDGLIFLPAAREKLIERIETLTPFNSIPWIVGYTSHDGAIRTASFSSYASIMQDIDANFATLGPLTLNYTSDQGAYLAGRIRQFYFGGNKIDKEHKDIITKMYTERTFSLPIINSLKIMRSYSTVRPIYFYQFGYRGKHSMSSNWDPFSDTDYGVAHMDDIQYIFPAPKHFPTIPKNENSEDARVMKFMTKLVSDFGKTGLPTPSKDPAEEGDFKWHAINKVFPLEIANLDSSMPTGYIKSTEDIEKSYRFWQSLNLQEDGWTKEEDVFVSDHDEL